MSPRGSRRVWWCRDRRQRAFLNHRVRSPLNRGAVTYAVRVFHVFQAEANLMLLVELALLVVKIFAFVNSLMYSAAAYDAANKLTKPAWTIILGLGFVVQVVFGGPLGLINLVFTIAAFVYLADVRPALASLTRRR